MARYNKASVLDRVILMAESLSVGDSIEILCHKKNRMVKLIRYFENEFVLLEKGFWQERLEVNKKVLRKTLKKVIKREFPRCGFFKEKSNFSNRF